MIISKLHKRHNGISTASIASDSVWQELLSIALFIAVVSYFWWPALAAGQVIVHADSAHHGLSLLTMLHQWLHQELDSLLWSPGIYGGHPLFAESQGGFLNPINIIASYFFQPSDALGVVHWLDMLASGLGVYVLCRLLNIGCWPALFAACAATHGTAWLIGQNNLTVHGSLVWVAWTMAAVQYWLNAPSSSRATLMAVPATFLLYAGYPHLAHGLVVYFASMVVGWLMREEGRSYLKANLRALVLWGMLAILLAVCLSAIQLLPLLELVENSHRSQGVGLTWGGGIATVKSYVSGTLFFSWYDNSGASTGLFGILSASIFAALGMVLRIPFKITGHLLATFVLLNLGIGTASPLFRFVYEHGLIPGLEGFRIMAPFLLIAVIGLAVLAAFAISGLSSSHRLVFIRALGGKRLPELPVLATFLLLCLIGSYYFFLPSMSWWNYVFGTISVGAILLLVYTGKRGWIGPAMALILITEIVVLRNGIYNFYDAGVLDKPKTVAVIQQDEDHKDFYAYHLNSRLGYAFLQPNRPNLDNFYRRFLGSLVAFPALQWGINSINGALALELHRRAILDDVLMAESLGNTDTPPGSRLIDVLGIRYFSFKNEIDTPGFTLIFSNPGRTLLIYRNEYSMPKLRSYFTAEWVQNPDEAIDRMSRIEPDTLVIESDVPPAGLDPAQCRPGDTSTVIERRVFSSQYQKIAVESACPGWLYLGDAYYPGWSASVDGVPAELYPAQVLGKAVRFPQGSSVVEFEYQPTSFYIGTIVSGVAWFALGLFILWRGYLLLGIRRFRHRKTT